MLQKAKGSHITSFILRKLDPDFWGRVRAKAASEGTTVKNVILRLLAQWLAAVAVLSLTGCAAMSPITPTPVPETISPLAPFTLHLGHFLDGGHVTITAKVQNVNGVVLEGVPVTFSTDVGTLSSSTAVTAATGIATTTITASSSASVTATAGTLTSRTVIASQPVVVAPAPNPSPTPSPNPTPAPTPLGPLSVTLTTAADVTIGTQTLFAANVKNGPAVSFAWTFGDGGTFNGFSQTTAHLYTAAGTGVASVTITDALGRRASGSTTVTINAPPPPPPPPPAPAPGLTVTLTANASTVAVGGRLDFTAVVTNVAAPAETITAYQWDLNGDGTVEGTSTIATRTPTVPYTLAGIFTARVTATTSTGRTATGTMGFVVTN